MVSDERLLLGLVEFTLRLLCWYTFSLVIFIYFILFIFISFLGILVFFIIIIISLYTCCHFD